MNAIPDFIDCDADPFVPDGWKVEEHRKSEKFATADLKKIQLFLSDGQKCVDSIIGHDLRVELKDKSVLNANILDFFVKHPESIPEEWQGKAIFFWGTIYSDSDGDLCVRCLDSDSTGAWQCESYWLHDELYPDILAALSAS